MRLEHARWWVLSIALVLPACGSKENPTPEGAKTAATAAPTAKATAAATAAMPTATASAKAERPHHARRPTGLAGMMLHAAHDLTDLKEPQKATLEKLTEEWHAASPRKEIKDLHTALTAQVKAGKIEPAKLTADYDAIDKAVAARHEKAVEVLNGLYASLDPAQRKALVAAVRAKEAEREKQAAEHEKKMNEEWSKKRLDHLTKELDLDPAQQKQVQALIDKGDRPTPADMATRREEAKKRLDAILTAFEGAGFDAKKFETAGPPKKLRERLERHVQFLSQLVPILKPAQRDKLAASMDKHAAVKNPDGAQHDDEHPYHPVFDDQPADEPGTPPAGTATP